MAASSSPAIDTFLQEELGRRHLDEVPAVEAARWLAEARILKDSRHRPGLPLRELMRAGSVASAEQRPPGKGGRWFVVRRGSLGAVTEASPLLDRTAMALEASRSASAELRREVSATTGERGDHRVLMTWMGSRIETLEDLLRPTLRVICIGINPAITSVSVGHYYQGLAGQRFLSRLRTVGLLPPKDDRWEDDVAFELGIGQTDVVKRATSRADSISRAEFAYGKADLTSRLQAVRTQLVVFTFKKAATRLLGQFDGHGFLPRVTLAGGKVFVMPGPYAPAATAASSLSDLAEWVEREVGLP